MLPLPPNGSSMFFIVGIPLDRVVCWCDTACHTFIKYLLYQARWLPGWKPQYVA
jgi:hypothetical protein